MVTATEEKRYEGLSPFELKNKLIQMAETHHERMMLNAGRGNPNWVATVPREAFFHFGHFAVKEANRNAIRPNIGSFAKQDGLEQRFEAFLARHSEDPNIRFLSQAFDYVRYELKIDADYLVKNFEPIDFVMRLAEEKSVVLMDGGGFDAPNMSVRVSLANLPDETYITIGKAISKLLEEYHNRYLA